jgi:hypothetical protein
MMKALLTALFLAGVLCTGALAAPLGTNARTVLPAQVQQIVSVDYRSLRNSSSGMALKDRVLPDNLKAFEAALRGMGVNPDSDVEQLTFISYRTSKAMVRTLGVAGGEFEPKKLLAHMKAKAKGTKYRDSYLYPAGSFVMTFLDENTMLFGDAAAVKDGLDVRDGEAPGASEDMLQRIAEAESGPVWSVLDQQGTQNMVRSVLGEAAGLADYDTIKKRLLGSHYTLDLQHGIDFVLDVDTSDTFTAGTLSALLNAGLFYKKAAGSAAEKSALENMAINSDGGHLQLKFQADDSKFQALMKSDLFQAVSH